MDKEEKKRLKLELRRKEKQAFEESLPMSRELFIQLFDYLDAKSEELGCNHTMRITLEFLESKNIPPDAVINWLNEQGGYCDCEVYGNVGEHFW